MKRAVLSFVLLLGVGACFASDVIPVPRDQSGNPFVDASYGGMKFSTGAFFTSGTNGSITIPRGFSEIGLLGASISSGPGTTFIEFFSSYSWSPNTPVFLRVTNATNAVTTSDSGVDKWFPVPWRVEKSTENGVALIWRMTNGDNNQLHNRVTIGYVLK